MPSYVLFNFFIYSLVNAFTPGPGNILALNTVTGYGWKKGKPLFFGIFIGYYVVQIICTVFVYGVSFFLPSALEIMKYIGAIYILWLAIHIALSKAGTENAGKSASFMKGFMLQLINIKIYMFGITALTGYVIEYSKSFIMLFVFGLIIATIGTIATITWIGMGMIIQKVYLRYYRIINIVLAIILLESAYSMVK